MNFAHSFDTHVLVDKYRKKKRQIKDGLFTMRKMVGQRCGVGNKIKT